MFRPATRNWLTAADRSRRFSSLLLNFNSYFFLDSLPQVQGHKIPNPYDKAKLLKVEENFEQNCGEKFQKRNFPSDFLAELSVRFQDA